MCSRITASDGASARYRPAIDQDATTPAGAGERKHAANFGRHLWALRTQSGAHRASHGLRQQRHPAERTDQDAQQHERSHERVRRVLHEQRRDERAGADPERRAHAVDQPRPADVAPGLKLEQGRPGGAEDRSGRDSLNQTRRQQPLHRPREREQQRRYEQTDQPRGK